MRKRFIYVVLFVLMLLPLGVKAASVSVSLSCPSSVVYNTNFTCKVNVSSIGASLNGLAANYQLNGLTYVSFTPSSGFSPFTVNSSGFSVGYNDGKSGSFTIGVITLKATSSGSIKLTNLDASDTTYASYSPASVSSSIRLKSTNNNLASLSLSNGTLSPSFSASTTSYTSTINANSVTINATKADNYASVSGTGTKSLAYGKNTFKVVVTSESGSTKTYTIVITRPDNRSANNYLKSLSLSSGSISFKKETSTYNVTVDSSVTSLSLTGALEDSKSSFVSGYGLRTVNLNYGLNTVLIKVKAENESIKTYTLNVTRIDNRSTNNYLNSLQMSGVSIPFNKDVLTYNVSVAYDINQVEIIAKAEDELANVVVNNFPLVVGDNTLSVVVTSESQATRTYTINVKRLSEAEKMSDNNNVSELKIFGHDFKLDDNTYEYDIKIGQEEKELLFYITMEDENAYYDVKGNEELKDGSSVVVTLFSESGLKQDYTFNISKDAVKASSSFDWITILLIGVGFIFGVILGFILGKIIKFKNDKVVNEVKTEPSIEVL